MPSGGRASWKRWGVASLIGAGLAWLGAPAGAAESVKIGILKTVSYGPIYIAQEKGYFAKQGLDVEIVFFDAAQPVSVGVVSGALDFGAAGFTAGFYNLAAQGTLRIVGGAFGDAPGYQTGSIIVSKSAYQAGLRSLAELGGHSVAVSQIGSALHYELGLVAEKYGIDLKTIRVLPLQSSPNAVAAVTGGQADAGVIAGSYAVTPIARGDVKLLGYVGDQASWQLAAIFTSTKMADEHADTINRFLSAFRAGAYDYHNAFIGPDGRPSDGPTAPEMRAILAKYTGESLEALKHDSTYIDAEGRLDVNDVRHQIAWFKAQNLLKGEVDADRLIDMRYVIPLPER